MQVSLWSSHACQLEEISAMLDFERSIAVTKQIDIQVKECYANALYTLLCCKEFQDGWYVEGFAFITESRNLLEHGWVELTDGSIIDPTFAFLGHGDVEYSPAIKLNFDQAMELVENSSDVPLILNGSIKHKEAYRKTREEVHKKYSSWIFSGDFL